MKDIGVEYFYNTLKTCFLMCLVLLLSVGGKELLAQNEAMSSAWQETKNHYNAASVGSEPLLHITALYRQQWIGIKGAPANMMLLADAPLGSGLLSHGVGIAFVGQKKGLFTHVDAKAQYALQLAIFKAKLSVGVELGLVNSAFDGTKVVIPEGDQLNPNDPAIPTKLVSGRTFDTGVGIFFSHPKFYVGLGAKHLFAPKLQLETNYYLRIPRTYNAIAGYNFIPSQSLLSWYPSLLAVTDFKAYRIDIGLAVGIAQKYFAGVMYRPNNAVGFSLKALWGRIKLCYAFEMPISELARGNYGTHELCISYAMPIAPKKDKGLMKKSIRLL